MTYLTANLNLGDALTKSGNAGLSVKHSFPYDHDHSLDMNIQGVYEQLHEMEEYQKEEYVAKAAFHR